MTLTTLFPVLGLLAPQVEILSLILILKNVPDSPRLLVPLSIIHLAQWFSAVECGKYENFSRDLFKVYNIPVFPSSWELMVKSFDGNTSL